MVIHLVETAICFQTLSLSHSQCVSRCCALVRGPGGNRRGDERGGMKEVLVDYPLKRLRPSHKTPAFVFLDRTRSATYSIGRFRPMCHRRKFVKLINLLLTDIHLI